MDQCTCVVISRSQSIQFFLQNSNPLPRIEDIFANLVGGRHFSKLDLRQAYHQMEVTEESKKYLTINMHKGLYNQLVFGVTSSPAIWQRAIDQVLQGIPGTQCILNDMIVSGKTDEEHLENLENVLKRLQDAGLKANKEKCEFFRDEFSSVGMRSTEKVSTRRKRRLRQ